MDRIKQVYRSLSQAERKKLKQFLELVHSKGENKPLDLIRMVEKNPEVLAETVAEVLYGDPKSKAFIMMKSRLYDRMLDFLCFMGENESFPREDTFYEYHIRYRKATLRASVLRGRKLRGLSLPLWREAVEYAQVCCAPEWELDGRIQVRNSFQPDLDEFEQISQQLLQDLRETEVNLNASGLYGKFLFLIGQREHSNKPFEYLERVLPELEAALQETSSPRATYYYHLMRYHLTYQHNRYEESKSILNELIDLLARNPGLLTDSRYHEPKLQLGLVALKMRDFQQAVEAFHEVAHASPAGDRLRMRALLLQLFPMLAKGELNGTQTIFDELESAMNSGGLATDTRLMPQFLYLKSCRAYLHGDLVEAWNLAQEAVGNWKDNLGSAVGLRLWEVMLLIERGLEDIASQRIESLRKHIAKYNCDERFRTVFKVLTLVERRGFDFSRHKAVDDALATLREAHPWDPAKMELIFFDRWFGKIRESRR